MDCDDGQGADIATQSGSSSATCGEFSFSGAPIDIRGISLIDPSTYVAPPDDSSRDVTGKIRPRRSRRNRSLSQVPRRGGGADCSFQRNIQQRKLFQAVTLNDTQQVERLLSDHDTPVEVSTQDKCGRTALHIAAAGGKNEVVRVLLSFGADPSLQDSVGNTPLHLAASTSKVATVTLLLQAGTDLSLVDCRGHTPVHLAASRLRHLRTSSSDMTLSEHSQAVEQVAFMMHEYTRCTGDQKGMEQVFEIKAKLTCTSSQSQVSEVADLLENFTALKLQGETPMSGPSS